MGRKIPLADDLSPSFHQTISFSLLLACMAAVIAISTTLCGVRFRKRSEPKSSEAPSHKGPQDFNLSTSPSPSPQPTPPTTTSMETAKAAPQQAAVESQDSKENEAPQRKELPLPPAKQLRETFSWNNFLTKSASTRNLGKNMSLRMPRSISMARKDRVDKNNQKKKGKLKHEDSVWMKTIILGEKCRVPDEDEAVIYDGKGNRISTYHPKAPSSLSVPRQNSFVDVNAIRSQEREKKK